MSELEQNASQPNSNTYGLSETDVQQLERFFEALAKDDLLMPAAHVAMMNKTQREQLRQYPDIFTEPLPQRKLVFPLSVIRNFGTGIKNFFKLAMLCTTLLGERSKQKPHYTFDLGRLVENGMELHILCTILRQSKKQKVLDVLPDDKLTGYLYGNAGRRAMWGIPFDTAAPRSFPTREAYNNIPEL